MNDKRQSTSQTVCQHIPEITGGGTVFWIARRDARLAAVFGSIAEVDTDARFLKYPPSELSPFCSDAWEPAEEMSAWPSADCADREGVVSGMRMRCPSSDDALAPADFCVIVRCRLGRFAVESSDSSDSLASSSDSDEVDPLEIARLELRTAAPGERVNDEAGARSGGCSSESTREGGRRRTGEEFGEPAALLRAAISRNAATEMRCEESDATLLLRRRGRTGGTRGARVEGLALDNDESADGDSGRICRKDLRLNESSAATSSESCAGESAASEGFDFLRSRWAQPKSPPGFFGTGGTSALSLV